MRFGGVDDFSGEQQIAGMLFADLPDQKNRDDGGKKPDAHFRVSEFRFGHRDREIAQCSEAASTGDGGAVYRGDGRLRETPDSAEKLREAVGVFALLREGLRGERLQRFQIHPGAERFSRAGENQHTRGTRFHFIEGGKNFYNHFRRNGVALVRPIQRNRCDLTCQIRVGVSGSSC